MQVAKLDKPGKDARWHIEADNTPGYFILSNKNVPNSFASWSNEESRSGYYMQMCTYTDHREDDAPWQIKAVKDTKEGITYFKLIPKGKPELFATYSNEESPNGYYMQIASYAYQPKPEQLIHWDGMGRRQMYIPDREAVLSQSLIKCFSFVPQGYKLTITLSGFNFGEGLEEKLKANAKPDYSSTQKLTVGNQNLNAKIGGTYANEIQESFTWGLNQKLGVSATTTIKTGIPFFIEGEVTLGTNFEFGSNQSWSTSKKKTFSADVSMNPKKPGVYTLGNIVYVARDIALPFNAKAKLTAKNKAGELLPANAVKALFKYEGLKGKIVNTKPKAIVVDVSGKLTASYGVYQEAIAKRISGLNP